MVSPLNTLGFSVTSAEELYALAETLSPVSRRVEASTGHYLRWSCEAGAEIWFHYDAEGNLCGLSPHFIGGARARVVLVGERSPEEQPLVGCYHAWMAPTTENPESGEYPFVFDVPDRGSYGKLPLPRKVQLQLAAFAHDLKAWSTAEQYENAQRGRGYASRSFVPSGLLTPEGETVEQPEALADFTGHVTQRALRKNSQTQVEFLWMEVETLGASIDVVALPELLPEIPPVGAVVRGSFWLTGLFE